MGEKKYDEIIIGGGLGGLTSAANLAKEGKRVLPKDEWKLALISPLIPIMCPNFASAWTMPCGEFLGCVSSGYACAEKILRAA